MPKLGRHLDKARLPLILMALRKKENWIDTFMRQMTLVGFLQAQNCTNFLLRSDPDSRVDSTSPDFYRHIGKVLEEGKFHLGFFDDRLAMPDMFGGNHEHTVEGVSAV